jgi:carbon-monoxide dehydrogenase medium subunit
VEEAVAILADEGEDAKLIAGGQSLVPMLNLRLARPSVLVDVGRLPLIGIERVDGMLRLGALVRHRTLEHDPLVAAEAPLLHCAASLIGHPAIRNRGTLAGSIAHADPAAELPAVVTALGARFEVRSVRETRWIEVDDLFEGPFMTSLQPDEMVVAIEVPRHGELRCSYEELAIRAGDFAVVGVAAAVHRAADGTVDECRIAISGAAGVPIRAREAERRVIGSRLDAADRRDAAAAAAVQNPPDDIHGSAGYRRSLADSLTQRALASVAQEEAA